MPPRVHDQLNSPGEPDANGIGEVTTPPGRTAHPHLDQRTTARDAGILAVNGAGLEWTRCKRGQTRRT